MNRISLLHRMDDLLEICKTCTRPNATPEVKCKGCHTYTQLKEIGNQLERGIKMRKAITKEQYNDLKAKGLNDKQIAQKLGISTATLYNRKLNWNSAPKQPDKAEKKTSQTKPSKEEQNAEYLQLIDELSTALNDEKKSGKEKDALIEKLEAKVSELESIHAACDDVESELTSLKEERDKYRDQLLNTRHELTQLDYSYENIKKENEKMIKTMALYETENMAMRELLRLWI